MIRHLFIGIGITIVVILDLLIVGFWILVVYVSVREYIRKRLNRYIRKHFNVQPKEEGTIQKQEQEYPDWYAGLFK